MNRQQLLSRLAHRGWPVVYSMGALNVWHRHSEGWLNAPLLAQQYDLDGVRVDRAGHLIPVWPSVQSYNDWAVKRYCRSLRRRAGFARDTESIGYLFWPELFPYVRALGCRFLVYHAVDNYTSMPGSGPEIQKLEQVIVARADLLIGTTADTLARLPQGGKAKRRVLHNGTDADAYASGPDLPCPQDLAHIPRPRICYSGHLNRKVDFNLIARIARLRPEWHWVLVGPETRGAGNPSNDPALADAFTTCGRLQNVHFLGCKSVVELPAYTGHADANVICYRQDAGGWWNSCYPLKLHDYLASGRPVISTPLTAVQPFAHVVDIATDYEEWLRALERALFQGGISSAAQRRTVARANTWDMRVDQLEEWLYEMLETKT
jgi:hypothetical protein